MSLDCDVAILGGGCAGLSLAVELGRRAPQMRVCILEERERYTRDRTWCFWNTAPHAFESCITHAWNSWELRRGTRVVRQQSRRYSYQHLPSDRFYEAAAAGIARVPAQSLTRGVRVGEITPGPRALRVETSHGTLQAGQVFDSRPPAGPLTRYGGQPAAGSRPAGFVQRFLGLHIRTEAPCFDSRTVQLMDFCKQETTGRTAFFYLLPFAANEALIEVTFLDSPKLAPMDAAEMLRARIEALHTRYEILYREEGALPMTAGAAAAGDARILAIGARGGRIRPSSGYGFLRIQRQSRALADALSRGVRLPLRYEPRRFALLDRIFLIAMQQNPSSVPAYFLQMFARVPADTLVRFLSEAASPIETLRTAVVLPKIEFAAAALTQLTGRSV